MEKPHLDGGSNGIYPNFQEWGEFFCTWNKRAQHNFPIDNFSQPNPASFLIQPSFPRQNLEIFNYSSSGYPQIGGNPKIFEYI